MSTRAWTVFSVFRCNCSLVLFRVLLIERKWYPRTALFPSAQRAIGRLVYKQTRHRLLYCLKFAVSFFSSLNTLVSGVSVLHDTFRSSIQALLCRNFGRVTRSSCFEILPRKPSLALLSGQPHSVSRYLDQQHLRMCRTSVHETLLHVSDDWKPTTLRMSLTSPVSVSLAIIMLANEAENICKKTNSHSPRIEHRIVQVHNKCGIGFRTLMEKYSPTYRQESQRRWRCRA